MASIGRPDLDMWPGWAIPQKYMAVCKHLCPHTNHNNVGFSLYQLIFMSQCFRF